MRARAAAAIKLGLSAPGPGRSAAAMMSERTPARLQSSMIDGSWVMGAAAMASATGRASASSVAKHR